MNVERLRELGVATVYEAGGQSGLIGGQFVRVLPGTRAAGTVRTVLCAQNDNLAIHRAFDRIESGDVVVATMPDPNPTALVGEMLCSQAKARGASALLIDAAVRDCDELVQIGLPIWARWVNARGPTKNDPGELDVPIVVGGIRIARGDYIVLDADGVVVVPRERGPSVLALAEERAAKEAGFRPLLRSGSATLDLLSLRHGRNES